MSNTEELLVEARAELKKVEQRVNRLAERDAFEKSFDRNGEVYVVSRRCIDTGRFEGILGVFANSEDATQFGKGLAAYGLGKDIFVQSQPFYS